MGKKINWISPFELFVSFVFNLIFAIYLIFKNYMMISSVLLGEYTLRSAVSRSCYFEKLL